ncbi:MAG: carboxypeptidase regulatory-like domain-containing protein [Bryobacterales bacterium]|nr:carboxypeptidase regulatory-like domain-containing protein [Bryobacterales bacterium]
MKSLAMFVVAAVLAAQPRPESGERGPGRARPERAPEAASNQKPGRLEGLVVHAKTGEPLRKASVTLGVSGGPRGAAPRSVTTEADGRFVFDAVQPGQYNLAAERTGYLRQYYSASKSGRGSSWINVASGQSVTGLEIKLLPHAVVAGKVLDADGEPMQGATVSVMKLNSLGGRMRASPMEAEVSNDLGEFRIYRLPPGRYFLMASRSRRMGPEERSSNGQRESYVTTYYPGSADLAGATAIELTAGQEVNGVTVQLRRMPVFQISGAIVNAPAGSRLSSLRVMLRPAGQDTVQMMGPGGSGGVRPDGVFTIDGVQPGQYLLTAMNMDREPVSLGNLQLTVGTSNITDLTFPLSEPVVVMGSVRMENGELPPNAGAMRVQLAMTNPMFGSRKDASLKEDGTFRIERVSREPMYVVLSGLTAMWVKSVKMGSQELGAGVLDLAAAGGLVPLAITLSDKVGVVEGTASVDGKPAAEGLVTLIPDPYPLGRTDLVRSTNITGNGTFRLQGLPPGEYRAFAWDLVERETYSDPDVLKKFESNSAKVTVKENATERVELKLVRADQP